MKRWILLLFLVLLVGLGGQPPLVWSADSPVRFDPDRGEKLTYGFSFLWFSRFGEGSLSFGPGPEPETYLAVAEGRTLGFASWVSRGRRQVYEVLMRRDADGWLRPVRTRSTNIMGKGSDQTEKFTQYDFDYAAGNVHYSRYKEGKLDAEQDVPMPGDKPVFDLLTAFYNWRLGLLGDVKPGSFHVLPTITKKGPTDIIIGVRTREDQQSRPEFPLTGLLTRVIVDEEVFQTNSGSMFVWLDPQQQPGKLLIEGVLGLGDVWAVKE